MGSKVELRVTSQRSRIGVTLKSSSEGGRQRIGSKVNFGATSQMSGNMRGKPEMEYLLLGNQEKTPTQHGRQLSYLWCTGDSFDLISWIILVTVSDCSSENIVASLDAEVDSQAFFRITWRIHRWKTPSSQYGRCCVDFQLNNTC